MGSYAASRAAARLTVLLVAWGGGVGVAMGQHAADPVVADPGCGVCHSAHGGASSTLNLKLDAVQVWGVEELGDVSRSCLRCHASGAIRARQSEWRARADALSGARLLGSDLSAQHPLGRRTPFGRTRDLDAAVRPVPFAATGAAASVECSSCHDPHDRSGTIAQPASEARVCGECHDVIAARVGHDALYCSDCHRMHPAVGSARLMLGPDVDSACQTCHLQPTGPRSVTPGPRRPDAIAHRSAPAMPSGRCTECHAAHR